MPTGKKQLVNESEKVSFADRPGRYGLGTIQSHLGLPPERAPKSSQLPSGRSAVPGPPTGRFPPAPAQLTHPTAGHQGVHRESQPVLVAEPGAGRRAAQVCRGGRLRRGDRGGPLAGHSSISLSPSERHHGRASSVMVTGGVTRWSSASTSNHHASLGFASTVSFIRGQTGGWRAKRRAGCGADPVLRSWGCGECDSGRWNAFRGGFRVR
jgi:hypothetical protein